MKLIFILLFFFIFNFISSQNTEQMTIPKGVVYNYCDNQTNEDAKNLIIKAINKNDFSMFQKNLMIGPQLWKRLSNIESLQKIEGKVMFHIDDLEVEGKMSQKLEDSKKIWSEIKKEIIGDFKIRKLNPDELKYYWSTISFDIDEPLFILETKDHLYILNFVKKNLKLLWIDEFPLKKNYHNPIDNETYHAEGGFKSYQNGAETYIDSKGNKETKLEKVILLSSNDDLENNSSTEDIITIVDKTKIIFEELFKNSEKSGKIIVQFELRKEKNEIEFAVKDDLDLEIMQEFEKRVNKEKYPNSKKNSIKFQLLFKVNSFNETE